MGMQTNPRDGWIRFGHAWREVGTAETGSRPEIAPARAAFEAARVRQSRGR